MFERLRDYLDATMSRIFPQLWRYSGAAGKQTARRHARDGQAGVVVEFRFQPGMGGTFARSWANPVCDVAGIARRDFRISGRNARPMFVEVPPGDLTVKVWADGEMIERQFVLFPDRVRVVSVHPRRARGEYGRNLPRIEPGDQFNVSHGRTAAQSL